jgi:aspartate racemase
MDRFRRVQQELVSSGAQVILLGCTELSLIKRDEEIGPGFLDIMEVLAQQSVLRCGKTLRKEYENLITG